MVKENSRLNHCPVCGHTRTQEFLRAPDRFHGRQQMYQLVKCCDCSLVWLKDPPQPEEIGIHYGADYDQKIAAAGEKAPQRWRDRRETLKLYKQGGTLLDIGCSSGSFLESLTGPTWELYGIEISPESAKRARSKTGAQIHIGDELSAPFAPCSFDVITCFHVLEHLYEPRQVFERVQHWLKPGGIFYFLVPNIDCAGVRMFGSYWYALELPRHLYHFSPSALRYLATSVGLEVDSLRTGRELFVEHSVRYIVDDILSRLTIVREPMATSSEPGVPFKIARKIFRMTVLPVVNTLAAFVGDGESIHGILRKRVSL
jgi:SAM-dependent methyltransferase